MIALARSQTAKSWAQSSRAGSTLAKRYVAGISPADAVSFATTTLKVQNLCSSLFYLGEYVDSQELVAENVTAKISAAQALGSAGLDVHISVDPTQIGHMLDPALARENAFAIAEAIAKASHKKAGRHALMLDMEDQSVTDATLTLHDDLHAAGLPVAITLQAYLRRTPEDLRKCIDQGGMVRLVKGAFAANSEVAWTEHAEIKAASRHLIDGMFSKEAKASGFIPVIATHDDALQRYASHCAVQSVWNKGDYEFEMLLGVRGQLAAQLAAQGERVRLYVPFGQDWWPHALRRIGENPANAWLLFRSLMSN